MVDSSDLTIDEVTKKIKDLIEEKKKNIIKSRVLKGSMLIVNKTKRKIFETSMKLFAEKGYDATSIEEITSTVGVAKGTLYYHFSSKEEIFDFLITEGIKLLQNSVDIKMSKYENYLDKIRAIVLIQIKIVNKYEEIISILLNQFWGSKQRNKNVKNIFMNI